MAAEIKKEIELEIAHVLFVDIVGYSKLLINEQRRLLELLNRLVRETEQFRTAEEKGCLITIPAGDGMALVFYNSPEAPVECALELSRADKAHPELRLRMGIHSGAVSGVIDVSGRANIAGPGINMAQRVMDCGDAGHILLSKRVAEDIEQYAHWQPLLHELGECEVKHGVTLSLVNLYTDELGNPEAPEKFKKLNEQKQLAASPGTLTDAIGKRSRWAVIAAAVLLVGASLLAGVLFFSHRSVQPTSVPAIPGPSAPAMPAISKKSIAVLPFENFSEEKENAFFAGGMHDDILTSLAKIAKLKVISRTSVMQYRGAAAARNLREIAQALGVANILEGSVRRVGNRVLVNVQLIDASNDQHIWAERYDRTIVDSIGLQGELATEIARVLKAKLDPEETTSLGTKPTSNSEAYVAYLRALDFEENGDVPPSEYYPTLDQLYAQAIALDPTFALAHARASMNYSKQFWQTRDPALKAKARNLADEALRLSPALGEAHLALGIYFDFVELDYSAALEQFTIALTALPNNVEVLMSAAKIYRRQGRWREAIAGFVHARSLDPHPNPSDMVQTYWMVRDWPNAAAEMKQNLAKNTGSPFPRIALAQIEVVANFDLTAARARLREIPAGVDPDGVVTLANWNLSMLERDFVTAERWLADFPSAEFPDIGPKSFYQAQTAVARGDGERARTLFEQVRPALEKNVRDHPDNAADHAALGILYAYMGRKEEAVRESRRAVELCPENTDAVNGAKFASNLALVYALTGEADQALPLVERLLQTPGATTRQDFHNGGITQAELRLRWQWDKLRDDPRFQKMLDGPEPKTIY